MHRLPALVLARRPRYTSGRSWIGGLPRLGAVPWPRTSAGEPMVFVAQLDLAELEAASGHGVFRGPGALAFFLSVHAGPPGAVRHVPAPTGPTMPPPDLPSVEDVTQLDRFAYEEDGLPARLFPHWPMEIVATGCSPALEEDGEEKAELAAWVRQRFTVRSVYTSTRQAAEAVGRPIPIPWQAQRRLLGMLRSWLADPRHPERVDQRREELEASRPAFRAFVDEIAAWGAAHDRWDPMSEADVQAFDTFLADVRRPAGPRSPPSRFGVWSPGLYLGHRDLVEQAFRDALRAGALPDDVLSWADRELRLGVGGWHQVFGSGQAVQGNVAFERSGDHLLLQLVTDDLANWLFGDNGVYQYFIRFEDLAEGRFEAAELEFECH